ncbi:hypothetical protein CAPTEDRAFT_79958, partial [Capitella teleta]
GIKSYILADSETGYCWNLRPYTGVSSPINESILNLMNRPAGHGHHLFMDNFYNSAKLTSTLLQHHTGVCGTLQSNRGKPAELKTAKLQKGD